MLYYVYFYWLLNVKSPATCCGAFICYWDVKNLFSFDVDKFMVFWVFNFEFYFIVCFSKQSVVMIVIYVSVSVEFGIMLMNDDVICQNGFVIEMFNVQVFSF